MRVSKVTPAAVSETLAAVTRTPPPAAPSWRGRRRPPQPSQIWVDGGYRKHFVEHAAALGIDLGILQRARRRGAASV